MAAEQKRKIKWAISLFLVILYFSGLPAYAQYGGGSGTAEDPYLIHTAQQMNAIGANSNDWDKHFKLMADIDLSAFTGTDFNIIGYYISIDDYKPFTGVFDGNGKRISNFTYISIDADYIGLFGYIRGGNVQIKHLGLIDPNVDAQIGYDVAALAGCLRNGTITGCYVEGGIVSGDQNVGGLVGANLYGTIANCYSTDAVIGREPVGGLVGHNWGTINDCYSNGNVSGSQYVGGLVGFSTRGIINNSYATGSVSGNQWIGGLVGVNMFTAITSSFWDTQTSGQSTSDGGTGKTTAEMKMESTFADAGWNFSIPIWTIDEGVDYPKLWWGRQESSKYRGGSGTAEDPYQIHTAQQMNAIGANPNDWDKHFKLMADIDLSVFAGTYFNIIGYYISDDDDNKPFTGVFDGNGHTISNFSYTSTYTDFIGLFRYVGGTNMEIKDLGLIGFNIDAGTGIGVGSLVGLMEYGAITNCYVRNGKVSGNSLVGGLAGRTYFNTITDCHVEADVSGFDKIGGLVGVNYAGIIKNCSSESDVFGVSKIGGLVGVNEFLMEQGSYIPGNITGCCAEGKMEGLNCIGGLVGDNLGRVTDSYATADVFVLFVFQIDGPPGGNRIGGLVGHNYYWTDALVPPSVLRCYSTGSITESILGTDNVGGLVGLNEGTVTDSFWDVETSGLSSSDGGTGRTTSQMQRQSTFINAGWDFVDETANGTEDIWWILEGQDYPRLSWELIEDEPEDEPNEVADSLSEAMDTHLSFTTGGNADWFSQTTTSRYDGDAAQSGDISNSQESWMQTTVSGKGTVKFYWMVSSEDEYDCLEFYIDGVLQEKISGFSEDYWVQKTYTISTSGSHVLEWRYMKDGITDYGSDCGWVDKVEWVTTP